MALADLWRTEINPALVRQECIVVQDVAAVLHVHLVETHAHPSVRVPDEGLLQRSNHLVDVVSVGETR
jgi:hypothetical protein